MARIVYEPCCGRCGFPIGVSKYDITYQNVYASLNGTMLARKVGANINPYRCAHCGALFDAIEFVPPKHLQDIYDIPIKE